MPRIYAKNQSHEIDWNHIPFVEGAAAVPFGTDVSFFAAPNYVVDNSKHVTTLLDKLTVAELRKVCAYLAVSYTAENTKTELVRLIEGSLSTKYIAAVTVASAAGDKAGDTKITITGAGTYKYKTGTAVLAPLYKDDVSDWTDIESLDQFTPTALHTKITVAEVTEDGLVIGLGNATITVNAG